MKFRSIEKVNQGKFITRYDLTYETEKGNIKKYEMISRNGDCRSFDDIRSHKSEAVVLIIHDKDNSRILLNKEYRMAVGDIAINFPAGLIDPGEDVETAAKRELWEETGLTLTSVKVKWPSSFSAVGIMNERSEVVIGTAEGEFAPSTSDEEEISAAWYTKDEIKELLKTSENFAARTQAYCYMWAYGA